VKSQKLRLLKWKK